MYLDFENIFDTTYNEGKEIERTIAVLKQNRASQMETVMLLIMKLGLSLPEADSLVVYSEAWKESREIVEKFRNDFAEFIKNAE